MATKYETTISGSDQTRTVKANSAEQAAVKGAAKHFFRFHPISAIALGRWAYSVSDKSGHAETVFVTIKTGEQAEYDERRYAI